MKCVRPSVKERGRSVSGKGRVSGVFCRFRQCDSCAKENRAKWHHCVSLVLPELTSVEGAGTGGGDAAGNLLQRLQDALQLSCVPEEAICQNTHRTGAR